MYNFKRAKKFFQDKISFVISPMELNEIIEKQQTEKYQIIDLRDLESYGNAHIPNSINLLEENLLKELDKLDKNKTIIVYCYNEFCQLSAKCALILIEEGFKVLELSGGFTTWVKYHYKTEKYSG